MRYLGLRASTRRHAKSLELRTRICGGDSHLSVARSCNNIGVVYDEKGDFKKALVHYQKGLEIMLKLLGSEHPSVANSKENIGLVFKKMTKKSEESQMFTEAAHIRRKVLGADKVRAIDCTVENKFKQVVLLNKEMIFEHDDGTLDTYL